MKFIDQARVNAKAGDGGDGCCSFRREKFVPRGGPDGGNGGEGGSIILKADVHTDNLVALYYEPHVRAKRGSHGQGKAKHGRAAEDTIVKVPVGTIIYRLPDQTVPVAPVEFDQPGDEVEEEASEEQPKKRHLDLRTMESIADLTEPGQEFVLCQGGQGGKGNKHFKSSTNRAPRRTTEGQKGEEGWFALELRTIADIGLVGYPNAGKSTLLGKVSAAHPRVASYPFTTLNPVVGVVDLEEYHRVTVADIPGLIEGAHENKGLGHEFLRHIVRCKLLLFVLDMGGSEGRDPLDDFRTLKQELKLYDPSLATRPWAVVANKMDLPEAQENLKRLKARVRKADIYPLAAESGEGVEGLRALFESVAAISRVPQLQEVQELQPEQ